MRAGNRIPPLAGELSGNRYAIGHVRSNRFLLLFRARHALQQADASVPSQNRFSLPWGGMLNHVATVADLRVELKPRTVLRGVIGVIASTHLIAQYSYT
jgi:hypothetical protein